MAFFIPVILGTSRPNRESIKPANFMMDMLRTYPDVTTELVDPLNLKLPFEGYDNSVRDPNLSALVAKADAFVIVTPEYNHSYPGGLKRLLDSESHSKNFVHKPVGFVGVSDGPWGGVRAIEALTPVARDLGLVLCSKDVQFANTPELFDENGKIKDLESYDRRARKMLDELMWLTKVLADGRNAK